MDELARQYNPFEAALWTAFALGFAVEAVRTRAARRRWAGVLAIGFLAFGFSDYLEIQTGAWWRPVGLLVLKVTCVGVLSYAGWRYHGTRRAGTPPN